MDGEFSTVEGLVAILPAAGSGSRMNAGVPKQYLEIEGRSILEITLDKLLSYTPVELVILVVAANDEIYANIPQIENPKIVIIEGGDSRHQSVNNALRFLYDSGLSDNVPVMVHDAARPCITNADLEKLKSNFDKNGNASFLASPVVDTLHKIDNNNQVVATLDRNELVRALTPQMAQFMSLKKSFAKANDEKITVTDEVSALRYSGFQVEPVIGRSDNIKVTHADDLKLAAQYLDNQRKERA